MDKFVIRIGTSSSSSKSEKQESTSTTHPPGNIKRFRDQLYNHDPTGHQQSDARWRRGGSSALTKKHVNMHPYKRISSDASEKEGIFSGCVFHLNGFLGDDFPYTDLELRDLILSHHGKITRGPGGTTTHVLCTQLPSSKIQKQNEKKKIVRSGNRVPMWHVRPQWVLDCISQKIRVSEHEYRVI